MPRYSLDFDSETYVGTLYVYDGQLESGDGVRVYRAVVRDFAVRYDSLSMGDWRTVAGYTTTTNNTTTLELKVSVESGVVEYNPATRQTRVVSSKPPKPKPPPEPEPQPENPYFARELDI